MWNSDVPVRISAFPVPVYDSPGNGNGSVSVKIGALTLSGHFADVGRNAETEAYFDGLAPEASGVVLVTVLVVGGKGTGAFATSRNHPVYLAEGRIAAPEARIDWLSIARPDASDLLTVNTRVFDLSFGRTVLVAPLADGTLRFLQVDTPPFPMGGLEEMDAFGTLLAPTLDTPAVRDFLLAVAPHLPNSMK